MTTLSEAFADHHLHLPHHILPLDFNSVDSVPESHRWPKPDDLFPGDLHQFSVPVIDLRDPNATQLVVHACETWGAFQLINHVVPVKVVEEVEAEAKRLFSLPTQQKLKALRQPGRSTGYGVARISPSFSKYMWHEGFTVMGSPLHHAMQLWPAGDCTRFCERIENYQKKMKMVAEQVTKLIFNSLNIDKEDTNWVDSACTALQFNSYPSCPEPTRVMGLAPHTDTSLITLLHQNQTNGLQIFKEGCGWMSVRPVAGALVVNVGDLLHVVSNGRFQNVLHRVMVDQNRSQRLSMAYFYGPPLDFRVRPLGKLLKSSGEVARYRAVTVEEYAVMKGKCFETAMSMITI